MRHKWLYRKAGAGFREFESALLDLRGRDFDHPVWVSPDWPPLSELDYLIHQIMQTGASLEHKRDRIWALRKRWEIPDSF